VSLKHRAHRLLWQRLPRGLRRAALFRASAWVAPLPTPTAQHVADGEPRAECIEGLVPQEVEVAARTPAGRAPVGADGGRRIGRIAREIESEPVDAAQRDRLAPDLVEVGRSARMPGTAG
jgi:hypothetical protein